MLAQWRLDNNLIPQSHVRRFPYFTHPTLTNTVNDLVAVVDDFIGFQCHKTLDIRTVFFCIGSEFVV